MAYFDEYILLKCFFEVFSAKTSQKKAKKITPAVRLYRQTRKT